MLHNPLRIRLIRLADALATKLIFVTASLVALVAICLFYGESNAARVIALALALCNAVAITEAFVNLDRIRRSV